jgi:hypothetical protein
MMIQCSRLQHVDSSFNLMFIGNRVDAERWFAAYKLIYSAPDRSIQGAYFEKLIHQWFDAGVSVRRNENGKCDNVDGKKRVLGSECW